MLIRSEMGQDGVLVATIDMPNRSMNVFSFELMDALEDLLDKVDATAEILGVVITSGKTSFLAGADLTMVRGFTEPGPNDTEEVMFHRCGRLGRLFVRLEASSKPWVAAVNGTALGGGLELAMACHARLVSDESRTLIGLPEVRWGLLPGAGGTQRLPRLIGYAKAIDMLLTGKPVSPQRAVDLGIFSHVVASHALIAEAQRLARDMYKFPQTIEVKFPHWQQSDVPLFYESLVRRVARENGVTGADFVRYPAYGAIIKSVLLGARQSMAEANDIEMKQFLYLMFSPVAGNMVRTLFLNRQSADRKLAAPRELKIESVSLGPISAQRSGWIDALAASNIAHGLNDYALPTDTALIVDNRGHEHRVELRTFSDFNTQNGFSAPTAILSSTGAYGRTIEIVAASDSTAQAIAVLAAKLAALPYRAQSKNSDLLPLAAISGADHLDEQALVAASLAVEGRTDDYNLVDVAACAAGISPAFSGGPFNWLWQEQERLVDRFTPETTAAWPELKQRMARSYPA